MRPYIQIDAEVATTTSVVEVPRQWIVPAEWPGVADLGPWLDEERSGAYPVDRAQIFLPAGLWELETACERVQIPDAVRDLLALWRPTPIRCADHLTAALGIRSRILYKDETACLVHSYKANAALAQAWFASQEGIPGLVAFTLSGYWGVALAWACRQFGIRSKVLVPEAVLTQRPELFQDVLTWNGELEVANHKPLPDDLKGGFKFAVGCFLNAVVAFNSVLGQESLQQLANMGISPDILVGCCGGGTNFGGMAFPFLLSGQAREEKGQELVAVEPIGASKFGHQAMTAPVRVFGPSGPVYFTRTTAQTPDRTASSGRRVWAPGLSYPTTTPFLVSLANCGMITSMVCSECDAQQAGDAFLRYEGIRPAPEAAYAVWGALESARRLDAGGRPGTVFFCLTGGHRGDGSAKI